MFARARYNELFNVASLLKPKFNQASIVLNVKSFSNPFWEKIFLYEKKFVLLLKLDFPSS